MGFDLQVNQTAQVLPFLMVLTSDHISPATGLSPTVTLSKNGAAFASPSGAVSEIGNGWYKVAGNATDANALGPLILHATAATADPSDDRFDVVSYNPQDAVRLGLTALPNANAEAAGGLYTRGSGVGQINQNANGQVDSNLVDWKGAAPNALQSGRVDSYIGAVAAGVIAAASFAAGALDAVWSTAARTLTSFGTLVSDTAAAVWNSVLTGATYNITNSAGKDLRQLAALTSEIIRTGTAQAGAAGTITLDAGASAVNNAYQFDAVSIISGTGAGQSRFILSYVGSTKVASIGPINWTTPPDATSVFEITPIPGSQIVSYATGQDPATLVWGTALPGSFGAGTAGSIVGTNLDTPVSEIGADTDELVATVGAAGAGLTAVQLGSTGLDNVVMSDLAAVPSATATLKAAINWLYEIARNKRTQTATTETVLKDDSATALATSAKSDDGVTFTRGKYS